MEPFNGDEEEEELENGEYYVNGVLREVDPNLIDPQVWMH